MAGARSGARRPGGRGSRARARRRLRRDPPGVRAGGVRRPRAPRRGGRARRRATARSRWRSPTAPSSAAPRSTTSPARLSARSLDTLDPPVLAALRLGLFQLLLPRRRRRARGRQRQRRAVQGGGRGRSDARQRRPAPRDRRGRRPARRARRRHGRSAPRFCTRCPSGSPRCGGTSSGPTGRARCSRRQRAGRVGAPRQLAAGDARRGDRRAARRGRHARLAPRTARSPPAPSTRTPRRCSRRGRSCPSRARRSWSRACSRRGPAIGCSTSARRPGAKTTHLAALMAGRARLDAVERNAAARRGPAPDLPADGSRLRHRPHRRRRGVRAVGALRPGARRPAVQRPRHAPVAARPALARDPRALADIAALQAPDPRRRGGRHGTGRDRSCTRSAPSRRPRARASSTRFLARARRLGADTLAERTPGSRRRRRSPLSAAAAGPRRHRRVLHRSAAPWR